MPPRPTRAKCDCDSGNFMVSAHRAEIFLSISASTKVGMPFSFGAVPVPMPRAPLFIPTVFLCTVNIISSRRSARSRHSAASISS